MKLKAFAKINLTLEVLGRRADGYHDIATVLQTIDLADEISVEAADEVTVLYDPPLIPAEDDLVARAARLLGEQTGHQGGARIEVRKTIPVAAGLGGGSSDAGATLHALNQLWGLGLDLPTLASMGAALGSDIPFFVYGGTAQAEGRGERVTPLPDLRPTRFILFRPALTIPDKTRMLYGLMKPPLFTNGSVTSRVAETVRSGSPLRDRDLFNAFHRVAGDAFDDMPSYEARAVAAAERPVHLCGSGPCVFGLAASDEDGRRAVERAAAQGLDASVVNAVARPVYSVPDPLEAAPC